MFGISCGENPTAYHKLCMNNKFHPLQMAYSMICKLRLRNLLSVDHMGALLTAAVCHDVDHPGLNNSYHSHARTPLAILYNYQSILGEQLRCFMVAYTAFRVFFVYLYL